MLAQVKKHWDIKGKTPEQSLAPELEGRARKWVAELQAWLQPALQAR